MVSTLHPAKCLAMTSVLALLSVPMLSAGVVFQVETTYHSGSSAGKVEEGAVSVAHGSLKMTVASRGSSAPGVSADEVVFHGGRKEIMMVDNRNKTYTLFNQQTLERLSEQVSPQIEAAMKQLEQLDPKQREMMEKMLKGRMGQMGGGAAAGRMLPEFVRSSERRDMAGYPCVRYDMLVNGEKRQELWVTEWDHVKGSAEVAEAFRGMADFWKQLMDSMADLVGSTGFFQPGSNPFDSLIEIDGFPVVTRSFEGGELESETRLRSVTERDLDRDAFEPPKGYRLRTMGPQ